VEETAELCLAGCCPSLTTPKHPVPGSEDRPSSRIALGRLFSGSHVTGLCARAEMFPPKQRARTGKDSRMLRVTFGSSQQRVLLMAQIVGPEPGHATKSLKFHRSWSDISLASRAYSSAEVEDAKKDVPGSWIRPSTEEGETK
jgi:hypothetical protein